MTAADTRDGMPWSQLLGWLSDQEFALVEDHDHTAPDGHSKHLVAAHVPRKLLLHATSSGPVGAEAVHECVLYGVLRQVPWVGSAGFIVALAAGTESTRVSRLGAGLAVFAFSASYELGLLQVLGQLEAAGTLVNWRLDPANPRPVVRLNPATGIGRRADPVGLLRTFLETCPADVRAFIRQPW